MRTVLILMLALTACGQTPGKSQSQVLSSVTCGDVDACRKRCESLWPYQPGNTNLPGLIGCQSTQIDPDKPWLWPA